MMAVGKYAISATNLPLLRYVPHIYKLPFPNDYDTKVSRAQFILTKIAYPNIFSVILPIPKPAN